MAVTSPLILQDQQQIPGSVQKTSAAATSFGDIVPFIVVISIIAVLSVVSCVVGRVYARRIALSTPFQRGIDIRIRPAGNWVEWIKKKFQRRRAGAAGGSCDQAGTNDGNDQVAVAVAVPGGGDPPQV